MEEYDFEKAYNSWKRVPIDDWGYFSGDELLILHEKQFHDLVQFAYDRRSSPYEWRNKDGKLHRFMRIQEQRGKRVVDFGCGLGLDASLYAINGAAMVTLCDLNVKTMLLAQRTLYHFGVEVERKQFSFTLPWHPWFNAEKIDLFWSNGVLHHTPDIKEILARAVSLLNYQGEIRITLYSDVRWREMTKTEPPEDTPNHPKFKEFVQKCDSVGQYADWYNEAKIRKLVEPFATLVSCEYLCSEQMVGAVIKAKELPLPKTP